MKRRKKKQAPPLWSGKIYVDGYNLLFRIFGRDCDLEVAKRDLHRKVVCFQSRYDAEVTMVYDGRADVSVANSPYSHMLRIVHSRMPETADQYILKKVEFFLLHNTQKPITVVTSDVADIWSELRGTRTRLVRSEEFHREVLRADPPRTSPKKELPADSHTHVSQQEIEELAAAMSQGGIEQVTLSKRKLRKSKALLGDGPHQSPTSRELPQDAPKDAAEPRKSGEGLPDWYDVDAWEQEFAKTVQAESEEMPNKPQVQRRKPRPARVRPRKKKEEESIPLSRPFISSKRANKVPNPHKRYEPTRDKHGFPNLQELPTLTDLETWENLFSQKKPKQAPEVKRKKKG